MNKVVITGRFTATILGNTPQQPETATETEQQSFEEIMGG